ncbi:MAG: phage tail protein I, partial [Lachnospiraceae bacterium]|nr:phage tail protein I [Lachnospiraceae bacterium]
MIKLQDAELISVLPPYIKENTDIQAISYAFKMGMEKLMRYAEISALYGAVDKLPESLINLMALELQSQYYEESLDLKVKREIVKNSLAWYSKSGTVSAVEELIEVVFGKGKLEEWFRFGGRPGTFRIRLDIGNEDAPIDILDVLKKIKRYKKLSAHFDAIVIGHYSYAAIRYANAIHIRINFYPRFNLPTLYLDGTWMLDGSRHLSGYDGYGAIDLY